MSERRHARLVAATALLVGTSAASAGRSPELELGLKALREGELARLERAAGPVESLPLYLVQLTVDPEKLTVRGLCSVTVTPPTGSTRLSFRLVPLAAHPSALKVPSVRVNGKPATVSRPEPTLLAVEVPSGGAPVTVVLELEARVPRLAAGQGLVGDGDSPGDYGAFSATADALSLTGVVPMLAPVGPGGAPAPAPAGIGDLGTFAPSSFVAAILAPPGWEAVAPGLRAGVVSEGALTRTTFAVVGARELPVFLLRNHTRSSTQSEGVTVEAWYRAGHEKAGRAMLAHAQASLSLLERRLGPYPFQSLKVVEAPLVGGAGGMEFPGLITVSTSLLEGTRNPFAALGLGAMVGGGESAELAELLQLSGVGDSMHRLFEGTLEFTVAHEVAHQYTGIMVGNDPVTEPIVDEPLTQHLALLVTEWRHGAPAADELRGMQLKMAYQLHRAMGGSDGKADRPTSDFESNAEYAALVYGKAPLLFDQWRKELGTEVWLGVLRSYVDQYRHRWATRRSLTELAARRTGSGARLVELQKRWWDELHGDKDIGTMEGLGPAGPPPSAADVKRSADAMRQLEDVIKQLSE